MPVPARVLAPELAAAVEEPEQERVLAPEETESERGASAGA